MTPDGLSTNDSLAGPAHALRIVLCDGIGCDGYIWKYLRQVLEPRARLIHWHYRGHGRSPPPRDRTRITIADHADDLACVLDDTGTRRAVIMGHSMGVQVALETFRRHRERVAGMVLLCGAPAHPLKTFQNTDQLEPLIPELRRLVRKAPRLFNRLLRTVLPTRLSFAVASRVELNADRMVPDDFMPYLRGMSRIDLELFFDMLMAANEHSAADLLTYINVPVLIIAGRRDGFTPPEQSRFMHEAIPESELLLLEEGSHSAPLEYPDIVGRAVLDFLDRRYICEPNPAG